MHTEERFNSISHLVGVGLALVGTIVLVVLAARLGDPWRLASFGIYGTALVVQYITSFLYHSAHGSTKPILRNLDHCAIYLLIAGTYSPFTLGTLRGHWGWPLFGAIWTLASIGIVQELQRPQRSRFLSLAIYLLMGWLAVLAIVPLISLLTLKGFAWLLAGGLLYTGGIFFYVAGKKGFSHGHSVWHLFVLGGSACHYFAVLLFVA